MAKTHKSDVYAFGCLYYEVSNNKHSIAISEQVISKIFYDAVPFAAKRNAQVMWLVNRGERPPRLDKPSLSNWAWKLVQNCWAQDALERPAMKDVMERMTIFDPLPVSISWLKYKKVRQNRKSTYVLLMNGQPGSPITSIVNTTTVNLIHRFLSGDDYINVAREINDTSVITDLVDLMLYLICHGDLSTSLHANDRARRLMLSIIAKTPVIPKSLFVAKGRLLTDRDLVDVGRFGLVFKTELWGELFALKVLHRTYSDNVSCSSRSHDTLFQF